MNGRVMRSGRLIRAAIPWVIAIDVVLGSGVAYRHYLDESKAAAVAAPGLKLAS